MTTATLDALRQRKPEILALADQYGISNVRVFGSVVRGEDTPESDIDILIDLGRGDAIDRWLDFMIGMKDLLGRDDVDVVPEDNLRPIIKSVVLSEARPL